jgi:hypothetical protein
MRISSELDVRSVVNRTLEIVAENNEDEQEFECNRWDDEEAYRDQVLSMVLEKGPPGLRRRITVPDQVFGDRRLRHFDSIMLKTCIRTRKTKKPTLSGTG